MPSVTGDSYGLALRAGAELVDMEQIQLLCFGATHPSSMIGIPLGEPAMAGPFGKLYNNKGEVICEDMMTKTRAQVANAMMEEIHQGGATEHGGLLLDLKPNVDSEIGEFYVSTIRDVAGPFIELIRRAYGEKASNFEEPWDVLPTVHYFMGGVKTDEWCRSSIPALYACGQAQGGVMGGNRLGATSLTEIFVFGKRAGKTAAKEAGQRQLTDEAVIKEPIDKLASLPGSKGTYRPIHIKRLLQKLMWTYVGARRDDSGLAKAIEEIGTVKKQAKDLSISHVEHYNTEVADAIELSHMLASAEAMALSALERKESRGAHVRSDFPEPEKGLVENIVVKMKGSGYEIRLTEAC
jgi:succinate dehydrogenase/fumarate reductase flavoprotein subunit